MWCSITQPIAGVGKASWRRSSHGIGYLLAWPTLYESFAVFAGAYPADVILVSHTLSIPYCLCLLR